MGDIADILGLNEKPTSSDIAAKFFLDKPKTLGKGMKKPKGMSREVFDLIGRDRDALVPSMQSNATLVTGAFKSKRASALKGKWVWASFTNSARPKEEGPTAFYHWVKADVQYSDYPYAKFNVKLDPLIFSDDEYEHLLKSDKWTRAETDHLMYICYKYDLRWPVIADRYMLMPFRRTEDMQERYYSIVTKIRSHRTSKGESNTKHEPSTIFDYEAEKNRRMQQECQFRKTKSDEAEEIKLREELKMIDSVLRTKKEKTSKVAGADSRSAIRAAASESRQMAAAANQNAQSFSSSPFSLPVHSDNGPAAGKPCLQSTRLTSSDQSSGLSRVLLKKMNSLLRELGVPEAPLPTRAVCDAYDGVKRDAVALLSLHNAIQKKEKEIATLKGLNYTEVPHKEIMLPHGSTLFSKMVPMDPLRPFPPPPPPAPINYPQTGLTTPSSSYQSFAPQGQLGPGQKLTGNFFPASNQGPGSAMAGGGGSASFSAVPSSVATAGGGASGSTGSHPAAQLQGGQISRNVSTLSSSAAFPSSSTPGQHMPPAQVAIKPDPAARAAGPPAALNVTPPKKLSSYKRKMAAIAAERAAQQALAGPEGAPPIGTAEPKEKKPRKEK